MIKKKTGDGDFFRLENTGRNVRVFDWRSGSIDTVKRFVRIRNIDAQAKWLIGLLRQFNAFLRGNEIGFGIFAMLCLAVDFGQVGIPVVRLVRCGVRDLSPDGYKVARRFHQVHQVGVGRVFNLIETLYPRIVWVTAGEHDISGRVTVTHLNMGVVIPHALFGELIDIGCGPR